MSPAFSDTKTRATGQLYCRDLSLSEVPNEANFQQPALIFDLDGTLVDSVYFHVAVWHQVLEQKGIDVPQWRIHRAVGMSGSFFLPKLLRDFGYSDGRALVNQLEEAHKRLFGRTIPRVRRFAGVPELLQTLRRSEVKVAIATSGGLGHTNQLLRTVKLGLRIPVLTGDDVESAKPAPDIFELAAKKLGRPPTDCFVVGDSVWDVLAARRMKAPAVALLTGGFSRQDLIEAGAYRVYEDLSELNESLEELGIAAKVNPGRKRKRLARKN
jgi:phosphoglycolate phosphatase-like HAD superfamily hydrolase